MSWAAQYIGQPWVHGEHDCWAFFRRVQAERFGRQVPAIDVDAFDVRACVAAFTGHDERARWQEVQQPQEGDAVLMSQSRVPTHVGVWVDGGVGSGMSALTSIFPAKAMAEESSCMPNVPASMPSPGPIAPAICGAITATAIARMIFSGLEPPPPPCGRVTKASVSPSLMLLCQPLLARSSGWPLSRQIKGCCVFGASLSMRRRRRTCTTLRLRAGWNGLEA